MSDVVQLKITEIPLTMGDEHWNHVNQDYIKDNTICNLRAMHKEALDTLTSVVTTHRATMADKTVTEAGNLARSYASAQKRLGVTSERAAKTLERAAEVVRNLTEDTYRVPHPPESDLCKLISDRLYSLKPDDRRKVISQ